MPICAIFITSFSSVVSIIATISVVTSIAAFFVVTAGAFGAFAILIEVAAAIIAKLKERSEATKTGASGGVSAEVELEVELEVWLEAATEPSSYSPILLQVHV